MVPPPVTTIYVSAFTRHLRNLGQYAPRVLRGIHTYASALLLKTRSMKRLFDPLFNPLFNPLFDPLFDSATFIAISGFQHARTRTCYSPINNRRVARRRVDSPRHSASTALPIVPDRLDPVSPANLLDAAYLEVVSDEQIVNTALILYLNAISIHCEKVKADWTLHRKRFIVESNDAKVYEARVDGYLRSRDNDVKAIVEVKPCIRSENEVAIRMQETAQMAAWICSNPPTAHELRSNSDKGRKTKYDPSPCD
ncbi:hypothetical protein F4778DRAFT_800536 [Xylariomycetidae sp. FL2044]|nr:hypothetical protein F4778DRAFT_800536 [Xylariomycetidae sp. FL2044]